MWAARWLRWNATIYIYNSNVDSLIGAPEVRRLSVVFGMCILLFGDTASGQGWRLGQTIYIHDLFYVAIQ